MQLAPSLPPALTSLAVAVVGRPEWWSDSTHWASKLADLAHLHRLQRLRLHNVLSPSRGQAPPAALAAALAHLEIVHEGRSCLDGVLSDHSVLPGLHSMHLGGYQLHAASLAAVPALQHLSLSRCRFSGCMQFSQLAALTRLDLVSPLCDGAYHWPLHGGLCGLSALRSLEVHNCVLRHGDAPLPRLPQLTCLRLRLCVLGERLCLSGSPLLRDLQLRCGFWDPLPSLDGLEELQQLTRLSLHGPGPRLRHEQLEARPELAVLQPASLAPPGWRPPKPPPPPPANAGAAEGDGSDIDSDSQMTYPGSNYDPNDGRWSDEVDSEEEQWEALTGINRFGYT